MQENKGSRFGGDLLYPPHLSIESSLILGHAEYSSEAW